MSMVLNRFDTTGVLILNWSSYSRHANSEQLTAGTALAPNHHTQEKTQSSKKLRRPRAHPFNSRGNARSAGGGGGGAPAYSEPSYVAGRSAAECSLCSGTSEAEPP